MNYSRKKEKLIGILNSEPYLYSIGELSKSLNIKNKDVRKLVDSINNGAGIIKNLTLPSKFIKIMKNDGANIRYGDLMVYQLRNEGKALKYIAEYVPQEKNRVKALNTLNAKLDDEIYQQIRKNSLTGLEQKFIEEIEKNDEMRCSEIAENIGIPFPSATRLACNLENMGYIIKNKKNKNNERSPYTVTLAKIIKN